MSSERTPRILQRLGAGQANRPWLFVFIAILTLFPAGWASSRLGFKSDFAELLPDTKESVIVYRRVAQRLAGASTLTVVAEIEDGSNRKGLEDFVDALSDRLRGLGPEWVGAVDSGVKDNQTFFDRNKALFARVEDLTRARDTIRERYDHEVARQTGMLLDDEEPPPSIDIEAIRKRAQEAQERRGSGPPYTDGYYMNKEGTFVAVLVRTPVSGKARTEELKVRVAQVVAELNPKGFDSTMQIRYTGDVITSSEEYDTVIRDLGQVGMLGVAGVLLSVLLFFMRVRTVLTMGATLLLALAWTFGLTRLTIGHLNSSTGFLVSIIAGNGINYSIMYMARYIEARRDECLPVAEAIQVSHRDSWLPTLASSGTAILAYGSLIVTDFRGFKHFGIIASYGMALSWIATYLFLPAILAASERILPAFRDQHRKKPALLRGYYGLLFANLAVRAPRAVTIVGVVMAGVAILFAGFYLSRGPIEYDMSNIRNVRKDETAAGRLSSRVDCVVGRAGQEGIAIVVDRLDQVQPLQAELRKIHEAAPAHEKPFEKTVTIFDLLPDRQNEKLPVIEELRTLVLKARERGYLSDEEWRQVEAYVPPEPVTRIGVEDLPDQVARPFTEKDGSRGKIIFIAPKTGFSIWDGRYLMRWADSFRSTTLPGGEVVKGSGRAVIFADMIKSVGEDAPKAIVVATLGTIIILLAAFRGRRQAWGVFLPWAGGLVLLLAFLYLKQIRLNFLNFVALPITIGIGAEYAHNMMQRYRAEGAARLYHVVVETGGAVILCSLTTTIGYLALMLSINQGIVSFGLTAAVGEIACLLMAVLVLPAALVWKNLRRGIRIVPTRLGDRPSAPDGGRWGVEVARPTPSGTDR